jgi:hypothetical protein
MLRSRKFLTLLVDMVVSLATYFVTKYAVPAAADDVLFVIGAIQPAVLFVIGAIAYEDAAAYKAGAHPNQQIQLGIDAYDDGYSDGYEDGRGPADPGPDEQ